MRIRHINGISIGVGGMTNEQSRIPSVKLVTLCITHCISMDAPLSQW